MKKESIYNLKGKRILFVGNSFIYYGNCVINDNTNKKDNGYFYQLTKANGEEASVFRHVYGGKNLKYIYETYLKKEDADFLASIDAVFLSEAGENNPNIITDIQNIISLFAKETKFLYLCHEYTHRAKHSNILSSFETMKNIGVTVVDWGGFVYSVYNNFIRIPDSELSYTRHTFVKDNKGYINGSGTVGEGKKGDDYHQNPLSGYICALMAYCSITGKPAYGQEYKFCFDKSIHPYFDTEAFVRSHYNASIETDMNKVFSSEHEMRGMQKLIDKYMKK